MIPECACLIPWMHKCSFLTIMKTALPWFPDIWVKVSCAAQLGWMRAAGTAVNPPSRTVVTETTEVWTLKAPAITETWGDGVDHYCHTNEYVQQLYLWEGKRWLYSILHWTSSEMTKNKIRTCPQGKQLCTTQGPLKYLYVFRFSFLFVWFFFFFVDVI